MECDTTQDQPASVDRCDQSAPTDGRSLFVSLRCRVLAPDEALAELPQPVDRLLGHLGPVGGQRRLYALVRLGFHATATALLEVRLDTTSSLGVDVPVEISLQQLTDLVAVHAAGGVRPSGFVTHFFITSSSWVRDRPGRVGHGCGSSGCNRLITVPTGTSRTSAASA